MKESSSKIPKNIPITPGVYFHKNKAGKIIYVGKAAVLRNRVRQYYQPSTKKTADAKTQALIADIVTTDWQEVDNELEALFLEAEMIKRYKPKYNILERDDKAGSFVRINRKANAPSVTTTRRPLDDGAEYFGPYLHTYALKRSLKYLRRIFPYSTHTTLPNRACLQFHLGLCPGPETQHYNERQYRKDLSHLIAYLKGNRKKIVKDLEADMKRYAREQNYEQAASTRNQLNYLKALTTQIVFSDKENLDLSKDHALVELTDLLGLSEPPKRIEGFDISHMSGTNTVASMVVFTNGVSDKNAYRKFKLRLPGNDDFLHMKEVISRRFSDKNIKAWGKPDLILIDGGKGQLSAAIEALRQSSVDISAVGLAKKFEQLIIAKDSQFKINLQSQMLDSAKQSQNFVSLNLSKQSHLLKLLQRIRDESHRFAVSYHSTLKTKSQTISTLDSIPTVGPQTRKKLLRHFGSLKCIKQARKQEIEQVIGVKKAEILRQYLRAENK